jgi:hypothetical protein
MAKVICTLPNASFLINGVKFIEHKLGVISEEIEEEVAAAFTAIKGYKIVPPEKVAKSDAPPAPPSPPAEPTPGPGENK